ncbi:hypothetical protein [Teredinibacter sp. KSP-S5-2]|uniref:hypothetical protein n=1 Tax=Teredinibacter sp. KSP-S5-2 TaxID=3034506 RepID=UPI0029350190|nr:hypothetical protein [Teredinibacter sp. KSP-S5-2]WNO09476.1 hypothetical protein P5V12_21280 [Teredinibacter sp. KSP-S5-2]
MKSPEKPRVNKPAPSTAVSDDEHLIVIGKEKVQVNAVVTKVAEDIAFLQARIKQMESSIPVNKVMLKTYKDMLASRRAVLAWFEEHEMVCSLPEYSRQETPQDDNEKLETG